MKTLAAALFLSLTTGGLAATPLGSQPQTIPGLGTATFPTSAANSDAQDSFIRGLLLLHVFEYAQAASAFQSAERADPGFAMAYWGEAMTSNHPVWNQLDSSAGAAALAKFAPTPQARAARIANSRERAYLAAVEILYDPAGTKPERDARYERSMRTLAEANPKDDEAQLFAALALLGRSQGVRDVPTYLKAASMAKAVFARNPQHPGAAHYWIHGMDDPEHAAGALVAADALSKIAPDAGHAQHMCSHIFMALGMWDAVVAANENAIRVVDSQDRAAGRPVLGCFHYAEWLEYAYFQQGRNRDAERVLAACQSTWKDAVAQPAPRSANQAAPSGAASKAVVRRTTASLIAMRAIAVIETSAWEGMATSMAIDPSPAGVNAAWDAFALGYAAAKRDDRPAASASLLKIQALRQANDPPAAAPGKQDAAYLSVLEDELVGIIASRSGDNAAAIASVQRAAATYAAIPFDFGPPAVTKPPHELLGELFLAAGDPLKARAAFTTSLASAPNRSQALLGLARAEAAAGDKIAATATYRRLLDNWHSADPETRGLVEARRFGAPTTPATRSSASSDHVPDL